MTEVPDNKDELLARYLLNELSQSENEDLEDEMVLDAELSERKQAVEMNLIDSYVMDEMSPGERLRFERGFLLLPENQLKMKEARSLHESLRLLRKERLEERKELHRSHPAAAARSWRKWLAPPSAPAYAALALLLALGLGYFFIPWRDLFKGRADNLNIAANQSPQTTPSVGTSPGGTPNINRPEELAVNQRIPAPPEVAQLPRQPEIVSRTILERPGLVNSSQTRGSALGGARPQSVTVPQTSKILRLGMSLRQRRPVENNRPLSVRVYNISDLDNPIFPGTGSLLLRPKRTGKLQPRYVVTIEIPTRYLRDGQTYYVRIDEEPEPTAFTIKMISAER